MLNPLLHCSLDLLKLDFGNPLKTHDSMNMVFSESSDKIGGHCESHGCMNRKRWQNIYTQHANVPIQSPLLPGTV